MTTISDLTAVVAQVRPYKSTEQLGSATGFWYLHDEDLFLITNRHVVINEDEKYLPDELRLRLHTDPKNIQQNADFSIPLYSNKIPQWSEHPVEGRNVDVVAIPVDTNAVTPQFFIKPLGPSSQIPTDVDLPIGADVQVIGYPLGFHDAVHNLPIIRNATIASVYPVPFQGKPYVLIDSRLHSGTSGSPVMTKPSTSISYRGGGSGLVTTPVTYFVGIHSATLDIKNRDPSKHEPLGLSVVWFAELIPQIITKKPA